MFRGVSEVVRAVLQVVFVGASRRAEGVDETSGEGGRDE